MPSTVICQSNATLSCDASEGPTLHLRFGDTCVLLTPAEAETVRTVLARTLATLAGTPATPVAPSGATISGETTAGSHPYSASCQCAACLAEWTRGCGPADKAEADAQNAAWRAEGGR